MEEVIKKLEEYDGQFDRLNKKLEAHDKKFEEHDKHFVAINKKLQDHDDQLDIIARTVADHTERLDRIEDKLNGMATKLDISKVMNTLDEIVVYYKKKDQETSLLNHDVRNLEDRVDVVEKDVKQMKPALGLS